PATYTFFPTWNVERVVVTVHDLLPWTHPELVFPNRRGRIAWQLKERAAVRWADRIVTVSDASRRALLDWTGWSAEKIRAITEGPDPIFQPKPLDAVGARVLRRLGISPEKTFLLYVGGLSPHKNLLRLVEAFAKHAPPGVLLVLAGDFNDVFHTH